MKRICVFCGSNPGARPDYLIAAKNLGQTLAQRGVELVYGGSSVGAMGAVADAALQAGGHVIGVVPKGLIHDEVGHEGLADLRVVGSMHERKALMAELSDAFIALPGGLGTLEEFFEVVTWAQLKMHHKPCGILNVADYYDRLLGFLDYAVEERLIRREYRDIVLVADTVEELLEQFKAYRAPQVEKWLDRGKI